MVGHGLRSGWGRCRWGRPGARILREAGGFFRRLRRDGGPAPWPGARLRYRPQRQAHGRPGPVSG
ncbi:Hypothetical protein I596_2345 [Dokdonella koreensis DS-123]|uniref:Uncharacterized protein n=1 Tax=Dokdonella koreensis DS-123 TaxID=1300342 RepID=A0A160DWR0_9GAMM|nr:Hypothetical protein I596_2345 [Dokdonella koreensis DS-123]